MSTSWGQPPAPRYNHARQTPRPWYKKKRWLLPLALLLFFGILGAFVPDEPVKPDQKRNQAQAPAATTSPAKDAQQATQDEEAAQASAEAVAIQESVNAAQAELDKREKAKAAKAERIRKKKARQKRIRERRQAKAAAKAEREAEEEEAREEAEEEAAPTAAYYTNCDAARDAGAAPLYRGDPGYGSHLDRDGDGDACES